MSNESLKKSSVSKEEARLYDYLDMAHHGIKHLEVEQGIQQSHMTQFLYGKSTSPLNDYALVNSLLYYTGQAKAKEDSFYMTIAEIVAILAFAAFNVYYIKRILDNKRTI